MSESNKAVVRRFTDLWNTGDLSSVDELIAPGYRQHSSQLDPFEGVDALAEMIAGLRAGFPDARFAVVQELAEGDAVAHQWILTGTQTGEWNGIPATGKSIEVRGTAISHLKDGKIVEHTADWDAMGMMQQLGVIEG
jgi:steroid delta-isomerase-like uncharacterized protein